MGFDSAQPTQPTAQPTQPTAQPAEPTALPSRPSLMAVRPSVRCIRRSPASIIIGVRHFLADVVQHVDLVILGQIGALPVGFQQTHRRMALHDARRGQ